MLEGQTKHPAKVKCLTCGKEYESKSKDHLFCCNRCVDKYTEGMKKYLRYL